MAVTEGFDRGGTFQIRTDESVVLTVLRALPDPPGTGNGKWSRALRAGTTKANSDFYEVDPGTYRTCLSLGTSPVTGRPYDNWESGKRDGTSWHRSH